MNSIIFIELTYQDGILKPALRVTGIVGLKNKEIFNFLFNNFYISKILLQYCNIRSWTNNFNMRWSNCCHRTGPTISMKQKLII